MDEDEALNRDFLGLHFFFLVPLRGDALLAAIEGSHDDLHGAYEPSLIREGLNDLADPVSPFSKVTFPSLLPDVSHL